MSAPDPVAALRAYLARNTPPDEPMGEPGWRVLSSLPVLLAHIERLEAALCLLTHRWEEPPKTKDTAEYMAALGREIATRRKP